MNVVRQTISEILAQIANQSLEEWLTESERLELAAWHDEARSQQWLAGRWLAKRELSTLTFASPLEIDIASRDTFGRSTAPRVCINGQAWRGSLSISHAGQHVVVAIDARPGHRVGVDVVLIQDHFWNEGMLASWFSADEQSWIRATHETARRAARLWAIKEATYKAAQRGESFIPNQWPALPWVTESTISRANFSELDDAVIVAV